MKAQPNPAPDPWQFALDALNQDRRAVLVMVVDHSGSVPGVTGTFVVVTEDGQAGTIGGGAAEHQLVGRARSHHGDAELVEFVHTPSGDGTLCNGIQRFAVLPLQSTDRVAIEKIVAILRDHQTGTVTVTPHGLLFEGGVSRTRSFEAGDERWSFTEPIGLLDTLNIIGGGHVSLALSRVMSTLPFRISVLDNRPDLPTMEANTYAHSMDVVDYEQIGDHVAEGDRSWVVVMTFGHKHDRQVVERLLGHRFRYLGLMGSETKIKRLFRDMLAEGADPEALGRVRAPIGMAIGSHTPEEIAVSIAGEIIGIRNGALD